MIVNSIKYIIEDLEEQKFILKLISALSLNITDFHFSNEIIFLMIHIKNLCEDDFYSCYQICKQLFKLKYLSFFNVFSQNLSGSIK